jgi:DNA polymerase III epsilon subunit-like protein
MIVVDVETTGLNPRKNSIVSIGAVNFENPKEQFYGECRPWIGAALNDQALSINGFSKEYLKNNKKSHNKLILEFAEWMDGQVENQIIGGHNPFFDTGFLTYSYNKCKIKPTFGHRIVDLHSICYAKILNDIKLQNKSSVDKLHLTSNDIFNYVGLYDEPNPHNGLTGAKMEAESLSRLILHKNLLEEFKKFEIPYYIK